jgi:acyl-CoA hydrolase
MTRVLTRRAAAAAMLDMVERPTVVSAMFPMQPDALLAELVAEVARRGTTMRLYAADLTGRFPFLPQELVRSGQVELITIGARISRRLAPYADAVPTSLGEITRRFAAGDIPADFFVGMFAEPDADGHCSHGPIIAYGAAALSAATHVVGDLNPLVRPVPGDPGPARDALTIEVRDEPVPVPELPMPTADDTATTIGETVAGLIPDGATLQLGIGSIPTALVACLGGHRDLGLHSGALPENLIPLVAGGVITGKVKPSRRGEHVTTSLLGGAALYEFAADPANHFTMLPVGVTHDPVEMAAQHRLFAINSALEVDLSGQANAEYAGGLRVSSPGGQADFMHGAHLSDGGAAIIALPSRSRDGRPRIVAHLAEPYTVTTHRNDVDFVITEYGVAELRGRSAAERARALVAIAHPDDRPSLLGKTKEAR